MPAQQSLIQQARQRAKEQGVSLYSKAGTVTVRSLVRPYLARLCGVSAA